MTCKTTAALAGVALAATAAQAQFDAFDDRVAWEDAAGGVVELEDFDSFDIGSLQPSLGDIPFEGGVLRVEGVDSTTGGPAIDGGEFQGSIFPATGHTAYVFTFDTPIKAFGWDTFGAATGIGIAIETDAGVVDIFDFFTGTGDSFLGFVATSPVTEVRIVESPSFGGTAVGEIFEADNLVFVSGEPCIPDFDLDGELTIFDFLAFQNAFDAGDLIADLDGDGELTIFDFLEFQNLFDVGCE
ncbi:MAG: GC-type dockerin domain-anchored protein [Planctomycetota bacterium]